QGRTRSGERLESVTSETADSRRQSPENFPASHSEQVAAIASEKFVSPVSGEAHGDRLASQARDEERRDLGGVGKRLIIDAREQRDNIAGELGRGVELSVVSAEVSCDLLGMVRLVEAGLAETNRECFHREPTLSL